MKNIYLPTMIGGKSGLYLLYPQLQLFLYQSVGRITKGAFTEFLLVIETRSGYHRDEFWHIL
jgi:hypothetical protein